MTEIKEMFFHPAAAATSVAPGTQVKPPPLECYLNSMFMRVCVCVLRREDCSVGGVKAVGGPGAVGEGVRGRKRPEGQVVPEGVTGGGRHGFLGGVTCSGGAGSDSVEPL